MRRVLVLALVGVLGGCGDTDPPFHPNDLSGIRDDMAMPDDLQMPDLQMPDLYRASWVTQSVPVPTSLYAIAGAGGEIFVVGDQGVILHSTDDGAHWTRQNSATTAALFGVWTDGATAIAVGYHGTLLRSIDHGATWQATLFGAETLLGVGGGSVIGDGGSSGSMWAVGEKGTVLQSIDGGMTWVASPSLSSTSLHGVWSSPVESFIVGDNGLYRTRDDGANWTEIAFSPGSGNEVWATGSGQILVANASAVRRSRDGALTWGQLTTSGTNSVVGFAAFANGEMWVASLTGAIDHYVNDFESPVPDDKATVARPIAAIWGSDPGNMFVVGDNGFIAHRQ